MTNEYSGFTAKGSAGLTYQCQADGQARSIDVTAVLDVYEAQIVVEIRPIRCFTVQRRSRNDLTLILDGIQ